MHSLGNAPGWRPHQSRWNGCEFMRRAKALVFSRDCVSKWLAWRPEGGQDSCKWLAVMSGQISAGRCQSLRLVPVIQAKFSGIISMAVLPPLTGCVATIDVKTGKNGCAAREFLPRIKGATNTQCAHARQAQPVPRSPGNAKSEG